MIAINSAITDPYLNHAVEEAVIQNYDDECFMLWKNDRCILLGKNQNAYSEINAAYVRGHNIPLVRRPTGGGTVFNDEGNLNFSFIASRGGVEFADFKRFTQPIIKALAGLGVKAEYRGRNDLLIEGKKFSGNAQCWLKDKVLHHGTLLYSADLTQLAEALNVNELKLLSKSIKSTQSRVTNISRHTDRQMSVEQFKDYLFKSVKEQLSAREIVLTPDDVALAQSIADKKYRLHSWNYGQKQDFNIRKEKKFESGLVTAEVLVDGGVIKSVAFFGDYFSIADSAELCARLEGVSYNYPDVLRILENEGTEKYFVNITPAQIAEVIV